MSQYRTGQILPLFLRASKDAPGSPTGDEDHRSPGSRLSSEKAVLNRMGMLADRRIVRPTRVSGKGHGSFRLYDKKAVLEMAVAFQIMGYNIPTETVGWVLEKYREIRDRGEEVKWLFCYELGLAQAVDSANAFDEIAERVRNVAEGFSVEAVDSMVIVNVGRWRKRIDKVLT